MIADFHDAMLHRDYRVVVRPAIRSQDYLPVARQSDNSRSMNLRHAGALALVGWYVISPPLGRPKNGNDYVDGGAPYYKWTVLLEFDDLTQCQERRDLEIQDGEDGLKKPPTEDLLAMVETESECIATDHPRLKEK